MAPTSRHLDFSCAVSGAFPGALVDGAAVAQRLALFPFGSPPFQRLVGDFRRRLVAEAAASDLPGLILTFVPAHDQPEDRAAMFAHAQPFRERGGRVLCLELPADQDERLHRNTCPSRLAAKPSKRDLQASRRRLVELDATHRLTSRPGELAPWAEHLHIDNTHQEAAHVATQTIAHFDLPAAHEPRTAAEATPPDTT
ncbi:hypothetical protein [Mangrovactinospora gilvigrisea]|nr:hypothetical protein [Mangrovactinospora gilvigrisea]